jgi:hypothetical protein
VKTYRSIPQMNFFRTFQKTLLTAAASAVLFCTPCSADELSNKKTIRLYFGTYPISYKIVPSDQYVDSLENDESIPENLEYSTAELFEAGLSIGYKEFTIRYSTPSKPSDVDIISKGSTTGDDLRFAINRGGYSLELFHKDKTGFHLENVDRVDSSWSTGDPYPQFPNMNVRNTGIQATFVLSPETFSLPALLDQNGIQKESGGSWIGGIGIEETLIRNDGPIVYSLYQDQYGDDGTIEWTKTHNLTLKFGGGYTLVHESLYIGGKMLVGGTRSWSTNDNNISDIKAGNDNAFNLGYGMGYNDEERFAGVIMDFTTSRTKFSDIGIEITRFTFEYFFGKRF